MFFTANSFQILSKEHVSIHCTFIYCFGYKLPICTIKPVTIIALVNINIVLYQSMLYKFTLKEMSCVDVQIIYIHTHASLEALGVLDALTLSWCNLP